MKGYSSRRHHAVPIYNKDINTIATAIVWRIHDTTKEENRKTERKKTFSTPLSSKVKVTGKVIKNGEKEEKTWMDAISANFFDPHPPHK